MKQNKKYIVITGQIASGKSTLSQIISEKFPEFLVLDADTQVNELYKRGAKLYNIIVREFGNTILNDKGNISKAKLREIVFFDEENRKKLNSLTHGVILENMIDIANNSDAKVIFLQIPLLSEVIGRLKKLVKIDEIWNVTANDEVRFNRLMTRKGMTESVARRIMKVQTEFEDENYDVINIENNGVISDLEKVIPELVENSCIYKTVKSLSRDFDLENKDDLTELNKFEEVDENLRVYSSNNEIENKEIVPNISNEDENITFMDLGDTTKIEKLAYEEDDIFQSEKYKQLEYDEENEEDNINLLEKDIIAYCKNQEYFQEEDLTKNKNKKKKGKGKRKFLIAFISIFLFLSALFFGSIAYGGKNYELNYIEEINKYSKEYGVDPRIVLSIMRVESNFEPTAESKANAKGLMQILPETSKHISKLLKIDENSVDLNDPETNIKYGTYYIKYLMQNFKDLNTVYAAYNGGIGNVNTWLKDEKYSNDGVTLYNIPVEETKHYVYKVNKALDAYEILYGKEFPTKKEKGFKKFIKNVKNVFKHIFSSF